MSAPTIQPSNPSGGASLAPDAGSAGDNSTINPTETRVQQQAAAAQAAQQASAAYAKRGRDVREYTDALVDYHGLPDEFRSTEAPDMTMLNRRGSEISSLRSPKGVDLAANARSAETQRFADWERDQLFEGDKLHRARDYLYYQRERANAGVTSYFSGERTGNYERDLVDVQQAYNEARNEGRDFVWEGKIADADDLAFAYSLGMINLGANESTKEAMYKAYAKDPLKIGRAGVLADPNSAESKELLENEYQEYLKFRDTPLTFENKVYMPRVASGRIAADAAQNAARVEYNAAQNADLAGRIAMANSMGISLDTLSKLDTSYRERAAAEAPFSPQTIDISGIDANTKHALMVDLGLKTFDELDAVIESRNNQIIEAYNAGYSSPEAMQAAEKAAWTAYQNRSAAEQTNPVLRDYAKALENAASLEGNGVYDELGQPQGLVFPNSISSLNLTTGNVREKIYGSLLDSIQSGYGVDRDVAEVLLEREISGDKSLGSEFSRWGKLINDRAAGNDVMSNYLDSEGNVIPPAPVTPDGGFTALNAITAVAGVGGVLANVGKSILPNIIGSAGTAAKSAGKNAALIAASYPLLGVTSSIGSQHTGDVFKPVEEFESMSRVKSDTGNVAFDKILDFGKGSVASVPEAGVAFVNALVGSTVLGSAVFQDIAETTRNLMTGNLQSPIETRNTISTLTTGIKGLGESTAIAVYQGIDNPAYMLGNILGFGKTYSTLGKGVTKGVSLTKRLTGSEVAAAVVSERNIASTNELKTMAAYGGMIDDRYLTGGARYDTSSRVSIKILPDVSVNVRDNLGTRFTINSNLFQDDFGRNRRTVFGHSEEMIKTPEGYVFDISRGSSEFKEFADSSGNERGMFGVPVWGNSFTVLSWLEAGSDKYQRFTRDILNAAIPGTGHLVSQPSTIKIWETSARKYLPGFTTEAYGMYASGQKVKRGGYIDDSIPPGKLYSTFTPKQAGAAFRGISENEMWFTTQDGSNPVFRYRQYVGKTPTGHAIYRVSDTKKNALEIRGENIRSNIDLVFNPSQRGNREADVQSKFLPRDLVSALGMDAAFRLAELTSGARLQDVSAHGRDHVYRVRDNALLLRKLQPDKYGDLNPVVLELAAIMHDAGKNTSHESNPVGHGEAVGFAIRGNIPLDARAYLKPEAIPEFERILGAEGLTEYNRVINAYNSLSKGERKQLADAISQHTTNLRGAKGQIHRISANRYGKLVSDADRIDLVRFSKNPDAFMPKAHKMFAGEDVVREVFRVNYGRGTGRSGYPHEERPVFPPEPKSSKEKRYRGSPSPVSYAGAYLGHATPKAYGYDAQNTAPGEYTPGTLTTDPSGYAPRNTGKLRSYTQDPAPLPRGYTPQNIQTARNYTAPPNNVSRGYDSQITDVQRTYIAPPVDITRGYTPQNIQTIRNYTPPPNNVSRGYTPTGSTQIRQLPPQFTKIPWKKENIRKRKRRYDVILPQNMDHLSVLDPLQAINPKKTSYMTNKRTPAAKGLMFEYGGQIHLVPPKWADPLSLKRDKAVKKRLNAQSRKTRSRKKRR